MYTANDKDKARAWAREMLAKPVGKVLVLDTETCDLYGEVIELAIVDSAGMELYNKRFNPITPIQEGAQRVHGITAQMLVDAPSFASAYPTLRELIEGAEVVLIYNAMFDTRCLEATCALHTVPKLAFRSDCIMRWYAQFYGEWRRGQYKWQPLYGGDHSALGDARAALDLLRRMAESED